MSAVIIGILAISTAIAAQQTRRRDKMQTRRRDKMQIGRRDMIRSWDERQIDWIQYHPEARRILPDPFFWQPGDVVAFFLTW